MMDGFKASTHKVMGYVMLIKLLSTLNKLKEVKKLKFHWVNILAQTVNEPWKIYKLKICEITLLAINWKSQQIGFTAPKESERDLKLKTN